MAQWATTSKTMETISAWWYMNCKPAATLRKITLGPAPFSTTPVERVRIRNIRKSPPQ